MRMRWWPVFRRNLLVWRKLALPSLIGNIAEPLIWLVAFGYGMGALVGHVTFEGEQVPYLLFLASGSICMSAMNAASFEALYSAFSRMHVQKTWDGIMNAPVSLDDVVLAEMLWAAYKAVFTATLWGERSRRLAAAWDGEGVDPEVVDVDVLRRRWREGTPGPHTLLQSIWLALS